MNELLHNLWNRRVVQFAAIYLGVSWVLLQVANQLEETLELPGWLDQAALVLLVLGFPIVLIVAWAGGNRAVDETRPLDDVATSKQSPPTKAAQLPTLVTDRPSIAVLPFTNMSNDPEQEFLADGMTEDIITGLSCNRHLFVIARNSSFTFKGRSVDVRSVGREFGVRYVLEGSVRRLGDRVRTTAQLIEADTGSHLWADKYDTPYSEIFDLQDDVINAITATLGTQLASAEYTRARDAKPADLGAWEWLQRALAMAAEHAGGEPELYARCFECLDRALEIDPDYAYARGAVAWYRFASVVNGVSVDFDADFRRASRELQAARELATDDPLSLFYIGSALVYSGRFDEGIRILSRALERNPNSADALLHLGLAYGYRGEFERAHEQLDRAMRLAPTGGWAFAHRWYRAIVLSLEDRQEEAIPLIEEHLGQTPRYAAARLLLAACQAEVGRLEQARATVAKAARDCAYIKADHLPPMLSAHPDPAFGAKRMQTLNELWSEVAG